MALLVRLSSKCECHRKEIRILDYVWVKKKHECDVSTLYLQAWSITYHSWLTFVMLLGACIIWMIPKSRELCLCLSPLLVVYGECLLIIQYVFGMNLKSELPTMVNGVKLDEVGLKTFPYPCLPLAVQVLYCTDCSVD